jgi:hypothetical protein
MRCLFPCLCALLLLGCTEPRVIVKTVYVEKPVPGKDGETIVVRGCPPDEHQWEMYCKGFDEIECKKKNFLLLAGWRTQPVRARPALQR